jgi:hypothetical protein
MFVLEDPRHLTYQPAEELLHSPCSGNAACSLSHEPTQCHPWAGTVFSPNRGKENGSQTPMAPDVQS